MPVIAHIVLCVLMGAVTAMIAVLVLRRLPTASDDDPTTGPPPDAHTPDENAPDNTAPDETTPDETAALGGAASELAGASTTAPPTHFADLVKPRFLVGLGIMAAVVTAIATTTLPAALWAPWLVLAIGGSLLACVDGATTWLPNQIMYPTWAAMAAAVAIVGATAGPWSAVRLLACAAGWGLVFWLVWLLARGRMGFGDVRLAVLLGAGSGVSGWGGSYLCLLAATVLGAVWGAALALVRRLRDRQVTTTSPASLRESAGLRESVSTTGFAYGLPLFLGCAAGLGLQGLLPV